MKRRDFLTATLAAGAAGTFPALAQATTAAHTTAGPRPGTRTAAPERIAGMHLRQLRDDYHNRLFKQYLPFWDNGGYDKEFGGVMCELNSDGSVANDEKYIWYQGRAIWVYSFLYNHFGKDTRWLDVARKTKDFMVKHMYAGDGRWNERVRRDGTLLGGVGAAVYGWLFAADGLSEYYRATGDQRAMDLADETIWAAVKAYDDPDYGGSFAEGETLVKVPTKGLRSQGHSMLLIWMLTQILRSHDDPQLERLQQKHVDLVVNKFWNPDFGIMNEYLLHDFSRVPGAEFHMFAGHTIETLWMLLHEALRIQDEGLFNTAVDRIRRILEMCWDYVLEGYGGEDFFVFNRNSYRQGPRFTVKTMWAHCEILIACMAVLEHTGEAWAKEWYERARTFTLRTMPVAGHGVWRQAVNRQGNDVQRVGISGHRKGNFHQPRLLMLNLLSLERMLDV